MSKKHRSNETWFRPRQPPNSIVSTHLQLSQDQRRLLQTSHFISDEDYEYDSGDNEATHEPNDDGQPSENGMDEFTYFLESALTDEINQDRILQMLRETQPASSAQVHVTAKMVRKRGVNLYSDNPNHAWQPYASDYLDAMMFTEGRRGYGNTCWVCEANEPALLMHMPGFPFIGLRNGPGPRLLAQP
ncbi:hypothetical protein VKT23_016348 [Stygiomarasmius scandens]|uniref:Uncharacterized protein n=1 Tax=Marasmiellus scandens TaxID=2682957 RepID=A0ABR1IYE6_9AGAR